MSSAEVQQALMQAEVWRKVLSDAETPADDPRLDLLNKSIIELSGKLAPHPTPPAGFDDARRLLDTMAAALENGDVTAAQDCEARLEMLFEAHPDIRQRYGERYAVLRLTLGRIDAAAAEADRIRGVIRPVRSGPRQPRRVVGAELLARAGFMPTTRSFCRAITRRCSERSAIWRAD